MNSFFSYLCRLTLERLNIDLHDFLLSALAINVCKIVLFGSWIIHKVLVYIITLCLNQTNTVEHILWALNSKIVSIFIQAYTWFYWMTFDWLLFIHNYIDANNQRLVCPEEWLVARHDSTRIVLEICLMTWIFFGFLTIFILLTLHSSVYSLYTCYRCWFRQKPKYKFLTSFNYYGHFYQFFLI